MEMDITRSHIEIGGIRYFVGNAVDIEFGGYGDKKTPLMPGDPHWLNQVGTVPPRNLEGVEVELDLLSFQSNDEAGIRGFAKVKVAGLGSAKIDLEMRQINKYDVRMLRIAPRDDNELIKAINDSPRVKQQLIDIGGDARVVEAVLVAVTYEHYSKLKVGLQGKAAVVMDGLVVKAGRSAGWFDENEVSVGRGTCLGYSLSEPKWDATRDKNKTRVVSLRPDQQGR